jgi:exodeoxyribonuclease VII large subunit
MFRTNNQKLKFPLKNGLHVLVYGQISVYEARGDYQLIVSLMEEAGAGLLHQKFLALKAKLDAEGLFKEEHKKLLPKFPNCVGIITSSTGAALKDILNVLNRRCPSIPVIIYPTAVQGENAAKQIVSAIILANSRQECAILILARGGGSIEDLWSFNEEIVARAIFSSSIPIVTGIGHEIDFTIADFVADKRAPTPSAAAELAVPDSHELCSTLSHFFNRLRNLTTSKLEHAKSRLNALKNQLKHPSAILKQQIQKLDETEKKLRLLINYQLQQCQEKLTTMSRALSIISPLATLSRGFAIVTKESKIVRSINDVKTGDVINSRFQDGEIKSVVKEQLIMNDEQ